MLFRSVSEQEHHKHTILKTTRNQFFEQKKITFWDGDKDNGEWRKDVTQCSPVDELSPYGEKGKKITGVIAKLRENSPYFVLEESRIKCWEKSVVYNSPAIDWLCYISG